ncbi:MAG: UDP-N-acetylglucosamine--N-acetylmuramyl-(pentapeptide) pyrophosphoryl-undecaprenol N-acetylglucosamine transferase [Patescibacteria group bacterium]
MSYRILLVGGGTGGHIYPLVAVGRELQKLAGEKGINLELMAVADSSSWRSEFESQSIRFKKILAPRLRRVEGGRLNFLAFLAIPFAFIQALWILFVFMPNLVLSKGGFASFIPTFVAMLYFIPFFIHESDSVPGLVNRLAAKFAKRIFISFENAARYFPVQKTVLSGNPVRENLFNGNKAEAAGFFNFDFGKKTILFLAGSQGAVFINNLLINSLIHLVKDFQIIHQAGINNFELVKKETDIIKNEGKGKYDENIEKNYRAYSFLNEEKLKNAFAMSDLVVSRSGSSIFEIAALAKPSIVIPYPYSAGNHQKGNAAEFAKFGAVVLEEQNLKPHILIDQIKHLLNNPLVGGEIKRFARLDAGEVIAGEILNKFQF